MKETFRAKQKEKTNQTLLAAAYRVFSEKGIINARMSDIAKEAKVSHGTVFLHFSSQEELICRVVEYYCGIIAQRTHALTAQGSLRDILSVHLDGISEFEPFYTRLVIESRLLPNAARDAFIVLLSAVSLHLSQGFIKAAPEADPAALFNLWMGYVHYYLANGDLFAPEGNVMERCRETLLEGFLGLLENRRAGKEKKG